MVNYNKQRLLCEVKRWMVCEQKQNKTKNQLKTKGNNSFSGDVIEKSDMLDYIGV